VTFSSQATHKLIKKITSEQNEKRKYSENLQAIKIIIINIIFFQITQVQ